MLQHKLLLAPHAIYETPIQQLDQFLLLGWVEACQYRDVVLLMRAKKLLLAAEIDKFSRFRG